MESNSGMMGYILAGVIAIVVVVIGKMLRGVLRRGAKGTKKPR